MARVFVTGGTGFIGRNLVERLVERGDQVTCLLYGGVASGFFDPLPVNYVQGDILAEGFLDPILAEVDIVYHVAGAPLALRPSDYDRINGEGTRLVAQACARQARPPVLVAVSSMGVGGPAREKRALTEDDAPAPVSAYGRSKLAAERHLRAVADRVPVTIVRPPLVFGPFDHHTIWLFQTVWFGFNFIPGRRECLFPWLHVADLVEGLILSAERGRRLPPKGTAAPAGEGIYLLTLDDMHTLAEAADMAARAMNRRLRILVNLPDRVCHFVGLVNDVFCRITGRPNLMVSDKITEGTAGSWMVSADKAKRELGFCCRIGFEEGFRRLAEWYRKHGWLVELP